MRSLKSFILVSFLFSTQWASGQIASNQVPLNYDLIHNNEFTAMMQLNPAFTGILEKTRVLANKAENINLGIESRFFKTRNLIGGSFQVDEIDRFRRTQLNLNLARMKVFQNGVTLKYAGGLSYQIQRFIEKSDLAFPQTFSDFNGYEYTVTQDEIEQFLIDQVETYDFKLGLALQIKNRVIIGAGLDHVNRPNVSTLSNGTKKIPINANAQLAGIFKLGEKVQLFPNYAFSTSNNPIFNTSEFFHSLGLKMSINNFGLIAQYDYINILNNTNWESYEVGLSYRWDRYFASVSYQTPLQENAAFHADQINITLNTTLRDVLPFGGKEREELIERLQKFY